MNQTISLITACMNRDDGLRAVLPSWLHYEQINEIIIVDWSSETPLKDLCKIDKRIKIVRVNDEKYYVPSQANNLAASFATGDYILRVDTDYFFNPYYNFFERYKIDNKTFVSGEPENYTDRENNPYYKYLFGLLYTTKDAFNKIGGYDENIGCYYSHEDGNIFKRLIKAGFEQIKLQNNHSVIHIPHSDKKRYEHFEGTQNPKEETLEVNKHIAQNLKFYTPQQTFISPKVNWTIQESSDQFIVVKKNKNKLNGIPSINCISLEESSDRRNNLQEQFKQYNINYINFLTSPRYENCNDKVFGKTVHTLNSGTTGCCISHIKNIKHWLETTNESYGFFCEDDLSLETVKYWDKDWSETIKTIPKDWECVQLLTIRSDNLSLSVRERLWNDWGATAYILKREYAQKIVNTYYKEDGYNLELPTPDDYIQPLIENLIFRLGKTYTLPLFVENINFNSTFIDKDNDINNETLQKNNHTIAHDKVLQLWKNKTIINMDLYNFATDIDNPSNNFKMGLYYYNQGHTAPALSYFLRCVERTECEVLAYEALIFGYFCYKEQKIRDETAKSLIMHAICLSPRRPEARWLLSVFFEQKQEWMYSYYHAERGLETVDEKFEPLTHYKDYPGKCGLLFQKAVSGYWWGKNEECKSILLDLWNNYNLNNTYKQSVKNNLKRLGIEV
jgi:hypothetical protein